MNPQIFTTQFQKLLICDQSYFISIPTYLLCLQGFFFLQNLFFFFCIGIELINNVVLISGVRQSDSVIHIYVSILFQILFPFSLLQSIEQSSLCYTVGPCWLSIFNIAVYTCQSHTPNLSLPASNHKFIF